MSEEKEAISLGKVTKAAHAMQNVLLLLQAHTEMLKGRLASSQDAKADLMVKQVHAIYFNTKRLSRLLDSVLIYEKAEHVDQLIKKERVDISLLLLNLVEEYRAAFPKVTFILRLPATLELAIDKEKVVIVLRNILENAIKYGREATRPEQRVAIKAQVNNEKKCIISVRDHGGGIDSQDLSKIFLPFYRGKGGINKNGSGLGLAISQEIMRLHRGSIKIISKKDGGVEVLLTLPL